MDRDFWQARWDEGRIGFHQNDINPYLQRYWPTLEAARGAAFVPLCGKSKDMLWLRAQGQAVIGVEIVARAVEEFFAENNVAAKNYRQSEFTVWEGDGIKLFCGDFFKLDADDLNGVTAVYDRASLIALPPPLRERYACHLRTILPHKVNMLLVTLDYPQHEMDGPPFAVTLEEVAALYQKYFHVEHMYIEDVLAANPRFQEQGLTRLQEKIYLLRAR